MDEGDSGPIYDEAQERFHEYYDKLARYFVRRMGNPSPPEISDWIQICRESADRALEFGLRHIDAGMPSDLREGTEGTILKVGLTESDLRQLHAARLNDVQQFARLHSFVHATYILNRKVLSYLLDPNHKIGGPKAKWLREALGFHQGNAELLIRQIKFDAGKAAKDREDEYGTMYRQIILITGANGRKIDVPFVFMWEKALRMVRLETMIPVEKA
jgi:uncharacterized protein DUF6883